MRRLAVGTRNSRGGESDEADRVLQPPGSVPRQLGVDRAGVQRAGDEYTRVRLGEIVGDIDVPDLALAVEAPVL
jgi:hypothetical protein